MGSFWIASRISDLSIPRGSSSLSESLCSCKSLTTVVASLEVIQKVVNSEKNRFKLHGEMERNDSIAMTLWIADLRGYAEKAGFVFSLETDTRVSIAENMEKDLNCRVKMNLWQQILLKKRLQNLCLVILTNVLWLKPKVHLRLAPYLIKTTTVFWDWDIKPAWSCKSIRVC